MHRKTWRNGIQWALLVLVLAGACWWWYTRPPPLPPLPDDAQRFAECDFHRAGPGCSVWEALKGPDR